MSWFGRATSSRSVMRYKKTVLLLGARRIPVSSIVNRDRTYPDWGHGAGVGRGGVGNAC